MNKHLIALSLTLLGATAFAQATPAVPATPAAPAAASMGNCEAHAAEKKLAGAAKNAFMKKCEREAGTAAPHAGKDACEKTAAEKKLAGAARNSFVSKCVKDLAAAK